MPPANNARSIAAELRAAHDRKLEKTFQGAAAKARTHDRMRALAKLTEEVDGEPRLVSDPPLIVPVRELVGSENDPAQLESQLRAAFRRYRRTLQHDLRALLEGFRYADLAEKVVGVGSVGTRCEAVGSGRVSATEGV